MKIAHLTDSYVDLIEGRVSRREYESRYPEIFRHYHEFWAPIDIPYARLKMSELKKCMEIVTQGLSVVEEKFAGHDIDISALKIVCFVGKNTSNGHAMKLGEDIIVWLPIETYTSPMLAKVFITHEIIHALHYAYSPDYYFSNHQELEDFARQLITEGVATFLTKEILSIPETEALWADYLPDDALREWYRECQRKETELRRYCLEKLSNSLSAPDFFVASASDDIYKFRAGYYIGTKLIEEIYANLNLTPLELLGIDFIRMKNKLSDLLSPY